MQFFFTIWPRGSEVGCCSFASCHIANDGPGDIGLSGMPAYEAESGVTWTVVEPRGVYCLPLGGDMGGECVNVEGTLTLTEFSPATGVVSGSYSLTVHSTGVLLSDVISGTICPVADKCE